MFTVVGDVWTTVNIDGPSITDHSSLWSVILGPSMFTWSVILGPSMFTVVGDTWTINDHCGH